MWVPVLISIYPSNGLDPYTALPIPSPLPTGLIFSCFMLSMTLGGMIFSTLVSACNAAFPNQRLHLEYLCILFYVLSALSMIIPIYYHSFTITFSSFLLLECVVGMFNAGSGSLRSKYYMEQHQGSIISIFRIPLNLFVVAGTMLTGHMKPSVVFTVLAILHLIAGSLQCILCVMMNNKHKLKTA